MITITDQQIGKNGKTIGTFISGEKLNVGDHLVECILLDGASINSQSLIVKHIDYDEDVRVYYGTFEEL